MSIGANESLVFTPDMADSRLYCSGGRLSGCVSESKVWRGDLVIPLEGIRPCDELDRDGSPLSRSLSRSRVELKVKEDDLEGDFFVGERDEGESGVDGLEDLFFLVPLVKRFMKSAGYSCTAKINT